MLELTPGFVGVRVTRSLVVCVCFVDPCLSFCPFSLSIVLSVLLRFTDSDYPFGIFKLFLSNTFPKFGSVNGRSMNMYYYGTSKSSPIWLPNRK
jgi:hypothetical protein